MVQGFKPEIVAETKNKTTAANGALRVQLIIMSLFFHIKIKLNLSTLLIFANAKVS